MSNRLEIAAQEYGVQSIPAVACVNHPDVARRELGIPDEKLTVFGTGLGYGKIQGILSTVCELGGRVFMKPFLKD